jgi:hypothetical protein
MKAKIEFEKQLKEFVETFQSHISSPDGQWTVKGFIDIFKKVYTISGDTKILSKILEIHLFPKILEFASTYGYKVVLADHQNYYPDISFVKEGNEKLKFAVDFKTTYRNDKKPHLCNGFTLGGALPVSDKSFRFFPCGTCLKKVIKGSVDQRTPEFEHVVAIGLQPPRATSLQPGMTDKFVG